MTLEPAIWVGMGGVTGVILWLLDRRYAGCFAESAGAITPATAGPTTVAFLLASPVLVDLTVIAPLSPGARGISLALAVATWLWIATIDWRWRIIPNRIVYPSALLALAASPVTHPGSIVEALGSSLLGFTVAGGVFLLFFLLSVLIYRQGGAFGAGDVKLAAYVGIVVGFPAAATAVLAATFVGALLAIGWGIARRSRKADFPYGPAIVIGAIAALLVPVGAR